MHTELSQEFVVQVMEIAFRNPHLSVKEMAFLLDEKEARIQKALSVILECWRS